MNADISDAPSRIFRKHHHRGVIYFASFVVIGVMTAASVFASITRGSNAGPVLKRSVDAIGATPSNERAPGQRVEQTPLQRSSNTLPSTNATRQTVFNDQSFVPRGADNVVSFHVNADPPQRVEPAQEVKITIIRQSLSMKDRACWPYRQGSIESRNCRAAIGLKHRD